MGRRISDSGFINKDGRFVPLIHGMTHEQFCKNAGKLLHEELKNGVIRVAGYGDSIVFESLKEPTPAQIKTIRKILHGGDYYSLTVRFDDKHGTSTGNYKPVKISMFRKLFN